MKKMGILLLAVICVFILVYSAQAAKKKTPTVSMGDNLINLGDEVNGITSTPDADQAGESSNKKGFSVKVQKFVGNINAHRYHFPWCKLALRIDHKDIAVFNSVTEALTAGFTPCKVCKPPIDENVAMIEKEKETLLPTSK